MVKVMLTLATFLCVENVFSGAPIDGKIQRINELAAELSKEYSYTLDQGKKELPFIQRLELRNCQLNLETLKDSVVIKRDVYDLTKRKINKKQFLFKGTYVLDFGVDTILKGRSYLHFDSKGERDKLFESLNEYVGICHKSYVKKYHRSIPEEPLSPTKFVGALPMGESEEAGSVFPEDSENYMALLRGQDSFRERYKAIKDAKTSIYLSQLFFRGDPVGLLFANKLIEKRMEGLDVRVMVSGLFNIISNGDFKVDMENSVIALRNMMAAGIRVHGVSCNGLLANGIRGVDIMKILKPSHIKNWLIDSEEPNSLTAVSISGGMNVSARYFRLGKRLQWLDQDIGSKGPILGEMRDRFFADFYEREFHYRTLVSDEKCLNTFDPTTQRKEYLEFKLAHTQEVKNPVKEEELTEWNNIKEQMSYYLQGLDLDGSNFLTPVKWVKVQGSRYVMGRPDENEHYLLKAHVDLINSAKSEILIANVFSLFVDEIKLALRRAAARGVKIRFITNEPMMNKDLPMVNIMGRFFYRDLVYGNHKALKKNLDPSLKIDPSMVEISEWVGKNSQGEVSHETVMHNKYMIVDKKVGLIGSFNMDFASLKNPEQLVLFENEELAMDLADLFNGDHRYTHKLTLEEINSFDKPKGTKFLLFISKILRTRL